VLEQRPGRRQPQRPSSAGDCARKISLRLPSRDTHEIDLQHTDNIALDCESSGRSSFSVQVVW
jgi:hypothetical protein